MGAGVRGVKWWWRREGRGPEGRRSAKKGGRKKGQRTTGRGRSQSCAHFFSWPNPKTLLCPPKINYPPYSKNETGREQRSAPRAARRTSRAINRLHRPIAVHSRPIQQEDPQDREESSSVRNGTFAKVRSPNDKVAPEQHGLLNAR